MALEPASGDSCHSNHASAICSLDWKLHDVPGPHQRHLQSKVRRPQKPRGDKALTRSLSCSPSFFGGIVSSMAGSSVVNVIRRATDPRSRCDACSDFSCSTMPSTCIVNDLPSVVGDALVRLIVPVPARVRAIPAVGKFAEHWGYSREIKYIRPPSVVCLHYFSLQSCSIFSQISSFNSIYASLHANFCGTEGVNTLEPLRAIFPYMQSRVISNTHQMHAATQDATLRGRVRRPDVALTAIARSCQVADGRVLTSATRGATGRGLSACERVPNGLG